METNRLTALVIGAAIEVQKIFGPGLLESAYSGALGHELGLRGLRFKREVPIPASYKGVEVGRDSEPISSSSNSWCSS